MKNTIILYIILGALSWAYLHSLLQKLARRFKAEKDTSSSRPAPVTREVTQTEGRLPSERRSDGASESLRNNAEARLSEVRDDETEESPAILNEAIELLKDPSFRRLIAMHRMEQRYGGTWKLLLPVKPAETEEPYDERDAA